MDRIPQLVANPFALLTDPDAVLRAIERSERLERLHSRICRPLDRPLIPPGDPESRPTEGDSLVETA